MIRLVHQNLCRLTILTLFSLVLQLIPLDLVSSWFQHPILPPSRALRRCQIGSSPHFFDRLTFGNYENIAMSGGRVLNSSRGSTEQSIDGSKGSSCGSLLVSNLHKIGLTSETNPEFRLVLASQSPRRREILDMMGLAGRYSAEPSPLNEQILQEELSSRKDISPPEYARILAERKAHAMGEKLLTEQCNGVDVNSVTFILGSDTIVDLGGHIMEKPVDERDAFEMLQKLSGNWHEVHTGVAVYGVGVKGSPEEKFQLMFSFTDTARVKFADLSETDVRSYIASKEPMDKAGSYGIQGIGGQLVETLAGDFFTVMGLPMHKLSKELSKAINSRGLKQNREER
mmetsp:Transcript_3605/g.6576  ORF Transcript_3605/g.6576 Transcript_3605/m.6576 type:complete len:342 (-) Transcript_3605:33-1058(-)